MDLNRPHSLESLSAGLRLALDRLVELAGGWSARARSRRLAYDSGAVRQLRRCIADLRRLRAGCDAAFGGRPGVWPRSLLDLLDRLRDRGCALPRTSLGDLRAAVVVAEAQQRRALEAAIRGMRQERSAWWRVLLPTLWRDWPGVVYHWLQAKGVPWGSTPVLDAQ